MSTHGSKAILSDQDVTNSDGTVFDAVMCWMQAMDGQPTYAQYVSAVWAAIRRGLVETDPPDASLSPLEMRKFRQRAMRRKWVEIQRGLGNSVEEDEDEEGDAGDEGEEEEELEEDTIVEASGDDQLVPYARGVTQHAIHTP